MVHGAGLDILSRRSSRHALREVAQIAARNRPWCMAPAWTSMSRRSARHALREVAQDVARNRPWCMAPAWTSCPGVPRVTLCLRAERRRRSSPLVSLPAEVDRSDDHRDTGNRANPQLRRSQGGVGAAEIDQFQQIGRTVEVVVDA